MYFDFEDYRPDITRIETAISWREGVLLSIIVHLVLVIGILLWPEWPEDAERLRLLAQAAEQRDEPDATFVFVQPRMEMPALRPPPAAPPSDINREARAPERATVPENPLPFSRGNTPELVERTPPPEPTRGDPGPPADEPPGGRDVRPDTQSALNNSAARVPDDRSGLAGRLTGRGGFGDSLQNPQRYLDSSQFENLQGGGAFGPQIMFDTKGVEFGPWVRRFVAQVKSNWLIPMAAMTMRGHVVITFNVHKSGALTDLSVIRPSSIEAFNIAAYGALAASNPTIPLPPEYPADKAFFTVTFYYNEDPPR
jgi:TonB family protein